VTQVEGQPPKRVVIQVWDSLQKMRAWRSSDDYREARNIGDHMRSSAAARSMGSKLGMIHLLGPPMTLGKVGEQGVHHLIARVALTPFSLARLGANPSLFGAKVGVWPNRFHSLCS
jgi:hypothetical protein